MKATIELNGPRQEIERLVRNMHDELDRMDREGMFEHWGRSSLGAPLTRSTKTTGTVTFKFGRGEQ